MIINSCNIFYYIIISFSTTDLQAAFTHDMGAWKECPLFANRVETDATVSGLDLVVLRVSLSNTIEK